jgi:hypothetical protein
MFAKWLISLKNRFLHGFCCSVFLIKWKEVQLSGEKCFFGICCGVSRCFFSQPGCQGAALGADPAPRRPECHSLQSAHDHQASTRLSDDFSAQRVGKVPRPDCRLAHAGAVVEAHFSGQRHGCRYGRFGSGLVSPELRSAAGISKDAILLGLGAYFELWDAQVYAAQEAEAMKGSMPDVFKDFSF